MPVKSLCYIFLLWSQLCQYTQAAPDTVSVYFAPGIDTLDDIARQQIGKAMVQLGRSNTIILSGYADQTGIADRNPLLASRRAEQVKTYLIQKNIPAGKIRLQNNSVVSRTTGNPKAYYKDRRVDIITISKRLPMVLDFPFNQAWLNDSSLLKFKQLLALMQVDTSLKITIMARGACPACLTKPLEPERRKHFEYKDIADIRLQVLFDALLKKGIDPSRINRQKSHSCIKDTGSDTNILNQQQKLRIINATTKWTRVLPTDSIGDR